MKKLLILIIVFSSCVAKKNTTKEETETKIDSIYITKDRVIIEKVTDTILINKACDSLGRLKPFKYSLNVPQGKIQISSLNNNITGSIELSGYVKSLEKQIRVLKEKETSNVSVEVVKNKIPFWVFVYIFASALIILLLLKLTF